MMVENKPVSICITIINSYTISLAVAVEIARMAINMHTNSFERTEDPVPVF
jgi:hypothetical protein